MIYKNNFQKLLQESYFNLLSEKGLKSTSTTTLLTSSQRTTLQNYYDFTARGAFFYKNYVGNKLSATQMIQERLHIALRAFKGNMG